VKKVKRKFNEIIHKNKLFEDFVFFFLLRGAHLLGNATVQYVTQHPFKETIRPRKYLGGIRMCTNQLDVSGLHIHAKVLTKEQPLIELISNRTLRWGVTVAKTPFTLFLDINIASI
jgi:hypothetical protein